MLRVLSCRSIHGRKTNISSAAGISENNAITASVTGLSTQDVGSECCVTKNPQHMPSLTESAGKAISIKNPAL
jgi:hypothetical protein